MKRIFTVAFLALFLVQLGSWAQTLGRIVGGFNTENFPQVSFIYHDNSPTRFAKSAFRDLMENGEVRNFDVEFLPVSTQQMPQYILILWEDLPFYGRNKFDFTRYVLTGFFREVDIPVGTQFSISSFNRQQNRQTALTNLTNGFTSDRAQILKAIQNHGIPDVRIPERYFPNRSDIFTAMREGVDILRAIPYEGTKAIIVFTAGRAATDSTQPTELDVSHHALRYHIPIYVFQFYAVSGVVDWWTGFASNVHGKGFRHQLASAALQDLQTLFPKISEWYRGHSYRITFISNASKGDGWRTISFRVNDNEFTTQLFPPPRASEPTIIERAKENVWLSIGLAILLLVLLALITWFILKLIAKRKKEVEDKIAKSEKENQQHIDKLTKAVTDAEQKRIDAEKERLAKEEHKRQEAERKAQEKEYKRLTQLMRTKNLLPRLQCKDNSGIFTFNVNTPHTTIGRKGHNSDLELDNGSVSRYHADIIFKDDGSFEIIDKGSKNKVLINGQFFERATLKNGDVIGLGEAVINFHM